MEDAGRASPADKEAPGHMANKLDNVISLTKRRGFVYPCGEIYGGTRAAWDYGPYGVELKENIKRQWWKNVVQGRADVVGLDSSIILPKQVWVASGHVGVFSDPLTECLSCHKRFRADQLEEAFEFKKGRAPEGLNEINCPECGNLGQFTEPRDFNMMLKTYLGVIEDESGLHYLRPETAQGIFVNFGNVVQTSRMKVPFGIGQVGKSFRNEITPGNFIFRIREFEQMELEFFCMPGTDLEWFSYWRSYCHEWLKGLGIKEEHLRLRDHKPEELAHYSKATTDFEYLFPFGWGELWGIADRTNYDLKQHQDHSGKSLEYFDPTDNTRYIPYVVEPSLGADRVTLAFLCAAYDEEEIGEGDVRTVLHFHPAIAPVKIGVLPLSKKLNEGADKIYAELSKYYNCEFDDRGNIGKRYRRQDEIGTPFCVCVDFDTAEDHCVTIRDRDTMEQIRLPLSDVREYINSKLEF